ncbi:MAG: ParB/RepB/Spo0J family partition protein [Desulfovibrio sp.]|jgi:ParB family chromosome partitioning protein|nr:ParB/RepB/Spo0J family partition protein [Desulfovibrio sp.]
MASISTGLGKGLDALIRETSEAREDSGIHVVSVKDIIPNHTQPRRTFNEKGLEELAASIRSQGLLQPLLVRPCGPTNPGIYEIVAGERRWRASQIAGLTEVPVLVRSFSAQDMLAAALIENLQREDLNPLEEALGIHRLKEEFGLSQEDLSKKLGKSRSAIANSLRLLSLPEDALEDLRDGRLAPGHARCLLSISESQAQERLKKLIIDRQLSVREAEGLASAWKTSGEVRWDAFEHAGPLYDKVLSPVPEAKDSIGDDSPAKDTNLQSQSARLLEIQTRIGATLNMAVRVTGKEDKGKISLSYTSKNELEMLLKRLSCPALENKAVPFLSGSRASALDSRRQAHLDGSSREAIEKVQRISLAKTEGPPALSGANNSALPGANHAALSSSVHIASGGLAPHVLEDMGSIAVHEEKSTDAATERT